jgi:hypothetical protein
MERTPFKEGQEILKLMIQETKKAMAENPSIKHVLLSTDMSWDFGTKTLDEREYTKWFVSVTFGKSGPWCIFTKNSPYAGLLSFKDFSKLFP